MRPRLRFLADLLGDIAARLGGSQNSTQTRPDATPREKGDVEEVRRRLDETRERLKRETPPPPESS